MLSRARFLLLLPYVTLGLQGGTQTLQAASECSDHERIALFPLHTSFARFPPICTNCSLQDCFACVVALREVSESPVTFAFNASSPLLPLPPLWA